MTKGDQTPTNLDELTNELKSAFDHFRNTYQRTIDPDRQLTNQEIHDILTDEYQTYEKELQAIKEHALMLIKKVQLEHDEKTCEDLLLKIKAMDNDTTK